mgnify:CR=1 FL=1
MRKLLSFLLITFLISCSGITEPKFEGKWEDPERKQYGILTITKNGDNYLIDTNDGKFVGTIENEILVINARGKEIKAMIDENGHLIIGGNTAVRIE